MKDLLTKKDRKSIANELMVESHFMDFSSANCDDCDGIVYDVRLQMFDDGSWQLLYGDAQYDTDHHGYWGASSIDSPLSVQESDAIAGELIEQAEDQRAESNS